MKQFLIITFVFTSSMFLSGCTGLKNIQDLTYIVAIGMDYDQGKDEYTVYLQGLNFANVAKQEGGRPTEPVPIFVATETGETLNLAVSKLYKKSEPPLFFGHVRTLVLSKNIVTHRFEEVIEEVSRNRSLRPTLNVMTTEENILDVFTIKALFHYPAIYTVLFKKGGVELSQDEIRPSTLMNFLRSYYEPMGAAKLTSLKIDQNQWKADKEFPILYIDGYSMFQTQIFKKDLPFHDAVFINWLLEKNVTLDQKVEKGGELVAAVELTKPRMKVRYNKGTKKPSFSINLSVKGDLLEKIKEIPLEELTKLIEDDIKKRITALYQEGVDNEIDVLNIGGKWYLTHPKEYSELKNSKDFYLDKEALSDVEVNVNIFHFNTYKYKKMVK